MYRIGFIDDDKLLVRDYKKRLARKGIELVFVEHSRTRADVLRWILDNKVKCMLVDYKLIPYYDFNGTQLVAYINGELPDLPCIILTNYCDQGISENLVIQSLFLERERMDADGAEFEEMITIIKQAVEVFNNRLKQNLLEFTELKQKKDNETITTEEEERFIQLFKLLRAYEEVDDIPAELLATNTSKTLTDILNQLDQLLDGKE